MNTDHCVKWLCESRIAASSNVVPRTPATVQIKGMNPGATADDLRLVAKIADQPVSMQKFSVVSVTLTLKNSGNISDGNTAKDQYRSQLHPSPGFGDPNAPDLGPFATDKDFGCHVGVEISGMVTPSDYKGSVILKRDILNSAVYNGNKFVKSLPSAGNPFDDTSPKQLRDDIPQADNSKGVVYDLDAPGPDDLQPSQVTRLRVNFREFAALDSGENRIPASSDLPWFARVSCAFDANAGGAVLLNDILGDNSADVGATKVTLSFK